MTHTFPSDVDVLLVSPTGQKFIVMSDVVGGTDWTGQTYTLDDGAAAVVPSSGTPVSGSFRPTNHSTGDAFPAPAPAAPYLTPATAGSDTFASAFSGLNGNGTWSLYVVDDATTGTGTYPGIMVTASNGVAPNATQTFALNTATRADNCIASFGLIGSDAVLTFDYDQDGLANLLEYALGLDPTMASLSGLPAVTLKDYSGTVYLSMLFHRSSLATDLSYIVQGSSDLVTWTDLGTSMAGGITNGPGFVTETGSAPNITVEVRDTEPDDGNPLTKRYLRLKITSP